ncbi:MAG: hypothetical protein IPP71_02350 [Bacteroidetes bacterium]|nr:hypothetical protein [Bacteroidota bacterium]
MNPIARNMLAFIVAMIAGGIVNMGIITMSGSIIPPPEGADMTTPEGIKAALPLLQPRHFIMPFLAHAFGAFTGALVVALLAVTHKMKFALSIGAINLIGGIAAVFMIPAPVWFCAVDLVFAYIPMAYIAGRLGNAASKQ